MYLNILSTTPQFPENQGYFLIQIGSQGAWTPPDYMIDEQIPQQDQLEEIRADEFINICEEIERIKKLNIKLNYKNENTIIYSRYNREAATKELEEITNFQTTILTNKVKVSKDCHILLCKKIEAAAYGKHNCNYCEKDKKEDVSSDE